MDLGQECDVPDAEPRQQLQGSINQIPLSYSYRAYGLGINSSVRIPGLQTAAPQPGDLELRFEAGALPGWADALLALPSRILSDRSEPAGSPDPSFVLTGHGENSGFQLSYSDGTRFVVDGAAARVWGTYQPPLTVEDMATYFLGPVLGFVLRRRNVTCLHASAVEIQGRAVGFCGDAGFGKSTTAAALALRGVPALAEDILALEEDAGEFRAISGYPRICLWPESVKMLLGREESLPQLTPVWEKRFLELDGQRAKFVSTKLPLGILYLFAPRTDDQDAPRVDKISPREALLELVQNTYMNWALDREQRAKEFDFLCRLIQHVHVRRITPHAKPEKLAALCDLIQRDASGIL